MAAMAGIGERLYRSSLDAAAREKYKYKVTEYVGHELYEPDPTSLKEPVELRSSLNQVEISSSYCHTVMTGVTVIFIL